MANTFEEMNKIELTRKQNGKYTLGDESLDRLLGLDQDYATLTPKPTAVQELAAASYLYGAIGYVATNFTAIPTGYVATFKKGGDIQTVVISGSERPYYKKNLISLCGNIVRGNTQSKDVIDVAALIQASLLNKESLMETAHTTCIIADYSKGEAIRKNIDNAIYPFSSDKQSLNSKNCRNNHRVLAIICCRQLGIKLPRKILDSYVSQEQPDKIPEDLPTEDILKVRNLYNKVVEWILSGYFAYRGADRTQPIARESEILNSPGRIESLHKLIKGESNINAIINMCATDYTADMIYYIMQRIDKSQGKYCSVMLNEIDDILSPASANMELQKAWTRKHIKKLTASDKGLDVELV